MAENNHEQPGFGDLAGRLGQTTLGALHNRGELIAVEWQEEKARITELIVWCAAVVFFGMMATILLTSTIVLLFPRDYRIYAVAGFTILFVCGAILSVVTVRGLLKHAPFSESIEQVKKDSLCFESLK